MLRLSVTCGRYGLPYRKVQSQAVLHAPLRIARKSTAPAKGVGRPVKAKRLFYCAFNSKSKGICLQCLHDTWLVQVSAYLIYAAGLEWG